MPVRSMVRLRAPTLVTVVGAAVMDTLAYYTHSDVKNDAELCAVFDEEEHARGGDRRDDDAPK